MKAIRLMIPGEPCAQGRPKFSTRGGQVIAYDPEKSSTYKTLVSLTAQSEINKRNWPKNTEAPIRIKVNTYFQMPKKKSKAWQKDAVDGLIRPVKKPDIDNVFKCITDALSGILYKDDSQIVHMEVQKFWIEANPFVEVIVSIYEFER